MSGRKAWLGLSVLFLLAWVLQASGQPPWHHQGRAAPLAPPCPGGVQRGEPQGPHLSALWQDQQLVETIELSDDQVKALRELDFTYREDCLVVRADLEKARLALRRAFAEETLDEKAIEKTAQEIADLKGKLFVLRVRNRLDVHDLLEPKQLQELREIRRPTGRRMPPGRGGCG